MRCEHCSNHQMRRTPSEPLANTPPPSLYKVPTYSTRAGTAPRAPGGARHRGGNRAVTSQPRTGQSTSYGDVKPLYGGGRRVGQEGVHDRGTQERQQTRGGATQTHRTREPHQEGQGRAHQTRKRGTKAGEAIRTGGTGNQNGADGRACAWEATAIKGMAWLARPVATGSGQPLLNRHQVGGVSCSPDGLFAQQEREPITGRRAVRVKRTYGGRPG